MVEPPALGMAWKLRTVRMLCAQVSAVSIVYDLQLVHRTQPNQWWSYIPLVKHEYCVSKLLHLHYYLMPCTMMFIRFLPGGVIDIH